MFSWVKRIFKPKQKSSSQKPRIDSTPKRKASATKAIRPAHKREQKPVKCTQINRVPEKERAQFEADMEIANKYIQKKTHKKAKEFAEDMGIKPKRTPRVKILESVEAHGIIYKKYANYETSLSSAKEASEDLEQLGYRTRIVRYMRGSAPAYVLYRYKKGMSRSRAKAPKKATKRVTEQKRTRRPRATRRKSTKIS